MKTADPTYRPPDPFQCTVRREDGAARVIPAGELDLDTVGEVEARLAELRAGGCRRIVLDLRGLTFMDSTGIRLVVDWTRAAENDGFAFGLVPGGEPIQRVFRLTGLEDRLPFQPG